MGDADGAREILDEVVRDGDESQKQEAGELLSRLS
jgi:pilus assembly protein FimV